MSISTEIPVHFTADAAARVAQLGIEREVQVMLDHTKQAIVGLESIEVEAWDDEFEPGQPHLTIYAWVPGVCKSLEDFVPQTEWGNWFVRSFHPDVLRWFSFFLLFREEHGR